ncbi:hypothetical protein [Teichococcus aestuarii]|uniref:hypothetical protein n=1 Tax=Teichococcus aestuarii TaxID=568898 RepID=UPI00361FC5A2
MRAFRLVSVSLEAERVLLGLQAKRFAVKAVLGLVAAVFLIAAFAMLHVLAGWRWNRSFRRWRVPA